MHAYFMARGDCSWAGSNPGGDHGQKNQNPPNDGAMLEAEGGYMSNTRLQWPLRDPLPPRLCGPMDTNNCHHLNLRMWASRCTPLRPSFSPHLSLSSSCRNTHPLPPSPYLPPSPHLHASPRPHPLDISLFPAPALCAAGRDPTRPRCAWYHDGICAMPPV